MLEKESFSFVTIAGQTSPGGVTITAPDNITPVWQYADTKFHDAIWRFLRFRVGGGSGNGSNHAFEQYRSYNWIVDHCDFSGGGDECVDIARAHDYTFQWCTITNSGPTGQKYGLLMGGYPHHHMTVHHNLIANHKDRYPQLGVYQDNPDNIKFDFRNNICYNFENYSFKVRGVDGADTADINMVHNFFKAGPETPPDFTGTLNRISTQYCRVFEEGNYLEPLPPETPGIYDLSSRLSATSPTPYTVPTVTTHTVLEAYDLVLDKSGAWPRDAMNVRTVNEVQTRTGGYGKTDDPKIQDGPAPPADADMDGMPDFWESGMGLNPNDSSDARGDLDGDGYTNIEEYINDLALARMCEDYYNPVYPIPNNWSDYNPSCCQPFGIEEKRTTRLAPALFSAAPNPVQSSSPVRFRFSGIDRAPAEIRIVDVRGSLVAAIPASSKAEWNSQHVVSGVYLAVLRVNNRAAATCRLLILE
jgi:hypothetical protein